MLCGYQSFVNLQINLIVIQYPVCLNVVFRKIRTKNERFVLNQWENRRRENMDIQNQDIKMILHTVQKCLLSISRSSNYGFPAQKLELLCCEFWDQALIFMQIYRLINSFFDIPCSVNLSWGIKNSSLD